MGRKANASGIRGVQPWGSVCGNAALPVGNTDIAGHPIRGIQVEADGVYGFVFEDDTSNTEVSLTLKSGIQYQYLIRRVITAPADVYGGGS